MRICMYIGIYLGFGSASSRIYNTHVIDIAGKAFAWNQTARWPRPVFWLTVPGRTHVGCIRRRGLEGGRGAEMDPGKWKSGGIDGRWLRGPNGHALSRGMIAPWFEWQADTDATNVLIFYTTAVAPADATTTAFPGPFCSNGRVSAFLPPSRVVIRRTFVIRCNRCALFELLEIDLQLGWYPTSS